VIIALHEDGIVWLYESADDAVRAIEALDAEATFKAIFDESGAVYVVRFTVPNDRARFLGLGVASSGEYTLARQNRIDVDALVRLLREARAIEPPDAVERLSDVARRLTTA